MLRHKQSQTWHHSSRDHPSPGHSPTLSPDGIRERQNSTPIQPINISTPVTTSAMTDVLNQQKQPSLMRRVSQKAANKLRRRTSSTSNQKDERSGPVLARHRSGSVNEDSGRLGIQHYDSLEDEDEAVLVVDQNDGAEGASSSDRAFQKHHHHRKQQPQPQPHANLLPERNVGIFVSEVLQKGTAMTRVTTKKKIQRMFQLNVEDGRVSWDPTKESSCLYIDDIRDIRVGLNARNYREELQVAQDFEDRWITIIYANDGKLKLLHMIAPTIQLFKLWTSTLEAIQRYRTEMMAGLAMQGEKFVDAHWRDYMASEKQKSDTTTAYDEHMSFEDVDRLCRRLHVHCSKRYLKEKFKRADRDNSGYLNFQEFRRFVKLLKERDEIVELWERFVVNPGAGMYRTEFRSFLRDIQKVDVDADSVYADKIFKKFCRQSTKLNQTEGIDRTQSQDIHTMCISREAFAEFLRSPSYNPPLLNSIGEAKLDRPLNEYFCSSSHNTYLMGRQVRGESSVEGYIRVLQRGCRCVEIDCWDGDDGRPVVTHGHTGTSEVLFSDVVSTIGKYAFHASPYPVILSLEVHCNLEQQVKMAESLITILGEKLVTEPFMTNSLILPSPQELKHRVLVKVKGSERKELSMPMSDVGVSGGPKLGTVASKSSSFTNKGQSTSSSSSTTSESDDPGSGGSEERRRRPRPSTKIAPELGLLGVYCRGQKFRNFSLPESKTFNHVFSFQEKSFKNFCKEPEKKAQLEKHNIRYLMRVYPSGFRVNSSNFDPLGFWRRGAQMVALNWQTYDLGLQLNDAMFASAHDKSGYVLKPNSLRGSRSTFDPPIDAIAAKLKKEKKEVTFSIDVISAQQLPRPKDRKSDDSIDPFIEVEIFSADEKSKGNSSGEGGIDTSDSKGISGLGAPQKRRTKVVRDDGFHPLFREKMKFSLVTKFESLVFVRFSVYNSDSGDDKTLIATYTAKLMSLQQGYRHLPLYDVSGEQYLFSTIFVKIEVNPMKVIDREVSQRALTTIENLKSTAKSVLSRSFSTDRRSSQRKPLLKEARR
ncbi:PLC-like phosphodiesterase [Geopyxis carbonaria]|nr:PLC-like phosphodiesterase [Geopyxis carbonaria]